MAVISFYAGVLALLFVYLSARVISARGDARVALGDGGNSLLQRRIRAHANFAEYVPLTIVLMALAAVQNAPVWALHLIGILLLAGRCIHAFGVSREPEKLQLRVTGMVLTFSALAIAALLDLALSFQTWLG